MGYHDRTYHRVVGVTGGMGFSGGGPLPRALMLGHKISITFKDIHGNEATIGSQNNNDVPRIIDGLEVSDVVSVSGANGAYLLW